MQLVQRPPNRRRKKHPEESPEHGVHRENRSATPHSNVPANTLIKELPKRIQSMDKEGRKVSCKIITSRYNRVTRQGSR